MTDLDNGTSDALLFHIGLHKTGASLLQGQFFTPENGYIPVQEDKVLRLFVEKFNTTPLSAEEYDDVARIRTEAFELGNVAVLSHERLSGYPVCGSHDRFSMLARIASISPTPKVLLVIREQKSWIYSMWKQSIIDGSDLTLREFIDRPQATESPSPFFNPDVIDYLLFYNTLVDAVGEQNVLVLPYELLRDSPMSFAKRIKQFTHDTKNVPSFETSEMNNSASILHLAVLRLFHRYVFKTDLAPRGLINAASNSAGAGKGYKAIRTGCRWIFERWKVFDARASSHRRLIKQHLGHKFSDSNEQLDRRLQIDLKKYRYY